MELTLEDVRQLTFELYLAQRENALLREANTELKRLLGKRDGPTRSEHSAAGGD